MRPHTRNRPGRGTRAITDSQGGESNDILSPDTLPTPGNTPMTTPVAEVIRVFWTRSSLYGKVRCVVIRCPFKCGKTGRGRHTHGLPEDPNVTRHRVAHCAQGNGVGRTYVIGQVPA